MNLNVFFFKVEDDIDGNRSDIMSASQEDLSLSGESSSRHSIRKKNKGGRCDEVLDLVAKKLQSSSEGKFSAYAKYIAQELETLSKEMAMYCQRDINEAIFEAQMGSLNKTSRVITEPLYSTPPQQLTDQPMTSHFSTVESSAGQFLSHFHE
jgi:predicted S18 family serine protease